MPHDSADRAGREAARAWAPVERTAPAVVFEKDAVFVAGPGM